MMKEVANVWVEKHTWKSQVDQSCMAMSISDIRENMRLGILHAYIKLILEFPTHISSSLPVKIYTIIILFLCCFLH